jgi:hypothetical protein
MDDARFDELLRLWQDGEASADELRELEEALRADPRRRRDLVASVMVDVDLHARFAASKGSAAAPAPRPRRAYLDVAAGFLLLAASAAAVGLFLRRGEEPDYQVASGRLVPVADRAFEVDASGPARVVFRDGARVDLEPGSVAVPADPFELRRGRGTFTGRIRVHTPAGTVTAQGGAFVLDLRPLDVVERPELVVEVKAESVRAEAWGLRTTLLVGEKRSFGPKKSALELARRLEGVRLTLADALERARVLQPGGIPISAALDEEDGKVVFGVDVWAQGRIRELDIDARTGDLIDSDWEDEERAPSIDALALTGAVARALESAPGGRAVSAEFEKGRIEVKILADGVVRETKLEAK